MVANRNEADGSVSDPEVDVTSARRRLLRGSFAVPTVLTLASGSALAAGSALACFVRLPQGVDPSLSNFFRVPRYTFFKGNVTTKLVKAADIHSLAVLKGFDDSTFISGKVWIKLDGTVFDASGGQGPNLESNVWVALQFSQTGTDAMPVFSVSGLSTSPTSYTGTGHVMSESCWTSI